MDICSYTSEYAVQLANIFHQAVHAVDSTCYTQEQKEAWAPSPPDYLAWSKRLKNKNAFMAMIDNTVVGFIELDPDGHIDCMYTLPQYQNHGVASRLYEYIEALAIAMNIKRLYVEASILALPFFEKRGFILLHKNEIRRHGTTLVNYSMEKLIQPEDA